MATPAVIRKGFHRTMSTEDLVSWLNQEGISDKDCAVLKEERFTGESFLLVDFKIMPQIKTRGQLILKKLQAEAKAACSRDGHRHNLEPPRRPSLSNALASDVTNGSTIIRNDLSSGDTPSPSGPRSLPSNVWSSDPVSSNPVQSEPLPTEDAFGMESRVEEEPVANEANENVLRVEEVPVYCTQGLESQSNMFTFDHTVYMYRSKVWSEREILRVYFHNTELLTKWGLSIAMIMDWVRVWDINDDEIPVFTVTESEREADIRVHFSETEGCSSMIGMDAETVADNEKPTMVLNLVGHPLPFQRSLVIHEFGHALGLDHEHQRSNFWFVMEHYFDKKAIPRQITSRIERERDFVRENSITPYDPESIMHFWFNLDWFLNAQHRSKQVVETVNLNNEADRRYLLGVHMRQGNNMLPANPSQRDFDFLIRAYQNPEPIPVVPTPSVDLQRPRTSSDTYHHPHEVPSRQTYITRLSSREYSLEQDELHFPLSVQNNNPPLTRDTCLQLTHKEELVKVIWDARAKWSTIGRSLGVSQGDLDAFCEDYPNSGGRLRAVLTTWIAQGNKYIGDLIRVLRSSSVGRMDLAESLILMTTS